MVKREGERERQESGSEPVVQRRGIKTIHILQYFPSKLQASLSITSSRSIKHRRRSSAERRKRIEEIEARKPRRERRNQRNKEEEQSKWGRQDTCGPIMEPIPVKHITKAMFRPEYLLGKRCRMRRRTDRSDFNGRRAKIRTRRKEEKEDKR